VAILVADNKTHDLVDGSCQVGQSQIAEMPALLDGIGATAEMWKFSLTALAIGAVRARHRLRILWQIVASNLACETR
jgi:hypothetical protein